MWRMCDSVIQLCADPERRSGERDEDEDESEHDCICIETVYDHLLVKMTRTRECTRHAACSEHQRLTRSTRNERSLTPTRKVPHLKSPVALLNHRYCRS